MKKILNWIVVIIVAFIITGLVCRAKIYDGMTEIKHIYNGMTPVYSIYDGSVVLNENSRKITSLTVSGNISARNSFGMVGTSSTGIIFGGYVTSRVNDFYKYEVSGNNISVTSLTVSGNISARSGFGMVGTSSSGIIFGGSGTTNLNDFYKYEVSGNNISVTSLTVSGNISARSGFGMVGTSSTGIIFGGYSGTNRVNDFYKYEVSGNNISVTSLTVSGNISARSGFGMVGTSSSGIIFGGYSGTNRLNDFYKYEVSGNNVSVTSLTVSGNISARNSFGMVGTSSTGIIFGGYSGINRLNDFYKYEVSGNNVSVTSLTVSGNISVRNSFGMVGTSSTGIIFGGYVTSRVNDFYKYDVTTPVKIYQRPVVPVITSFSVTPTNIDLDDRLTGTISFSLGVIGTAGQVTTARIIRVRDNAQIGTTFTGGSGLNLSQTLPNISQPLRTETYRLIATNTDGNSHRDATVTVTKNPTLTNCRRTNYIDATTLYEFAFTLTGLPRPSVRYVFTQNNIAGQQGQVPYNHYAQGSNPYTWNVTGWRINFANSNARSLRLTASNSSGSSSCTINNIND